jgi:RimJ/RimL family protein N-acetyltransferase
MAGIPSPDNFADPAIPFTDFESRWSTLASIWGLSTSELRELCTDDSFTLVPFAKSKADFETYSAIRCNAGGTYEHMKLYADAVIPDATALRQSFSARVDRQMESQSLGLFIVVRHPETGGHEVPGWVVGGRFNVKEAAPPRGAEIAFIKRETWRARDGLVTKATLRFVGLIRRLRERGVFHVEYLYATCHKDNVKSFNVLTRSGFAVDEGRQNTAAAMKWGDGRVLFTLTF